MLNARVGRNLWPREISESNFYCFRIAALGTNAITKPATLADQLEALFGVNVLPEEKKVINGVTCLQWTASPGSITNVPTEGNASMTIRGNCLSALVNKAGRGDGAKSHEQTCVVVGFS